MKSAQRPSFSLYLPAEADDLRWGLRVIDCGYAEIPPNSNYPLQKSGHPPEYMFSYKEGRTLSEYQLVYISQGRGSFESTETGRMQIDSGKVFFLYPDIWHRFRPVATTGWIENWVGFSGEVADRIMSGFFTPLKPVIEVGPDQELFHLIRSISGVMDKAPPGYQQIAAARTMEVLALIRSRSMSSSPTNRESARKVQEAREYLAENMKESVDLTELARKLGLSYSRFRSIFKEHTGVSPHQYHLDMRLNLARYLLTDSTLPIGEVAGHLGFNSPYYFSRVFKNKNGCSPRSFRERKGDGQQPSA